MTQRHDSVLSDDYFKFLVATTQLYKELYKELSSRINGYDILLKNYVNDTTPLEKLKEAKDSTLGLLDSTSIRINLQQMEYARLEYFMLHGNKVIGIHPELEASFYEWNLTRMKTEMTLH